LAGNGKIIQVCKVAALYVGTVIGAGFASGQEIMQFFISFGSRGLAGAVLAAVLFALLGLIMMGIATARKAESYADVLPCLMGGKLAGLVDLLSLLMLFGGLAVMLAGSGAVLNEQFGWPQYAGTTLAALITAAVVFGGLQGVLAINMILVPLKILFILVVCALTLPTKGLACPHVETRTAAQAAAGWIWSAVLYVSYNTVTPLAVLSSLGAHIPRRTAMLGGLVGGMLLGAAVFLVAVTGLLFYPEIGGCQVPMLYIAGNLGGFWRSGLGVLIWVAVVTTAIADTFGFVSRVATRGGRMYRWAGPATILLALPLAQLDFAGLIRMLYPLFGYAGLLLMLTLLMSPGWNFCRRG